MNIRMIRVVFLSAIITASYLLISPVAKAENSTEQDRLIAANRLYNDLVKMSKNAYSGCDEVMPEPGWEIVRNFNFTYMHAKLWQHKSGCTILAFRGTDKVFNDPVSMVLTRQIISNDVKADIDMTTLRFSMPENLSNVTEILKGVIKEHPNTIFVGHSKGGMEAGFCSCITGNKSIVFDCPGIPIDALSIYIMKNQKSDARCRMDMVLGVFGENDPFHELGIGQKKRFYQPNINLEVQLLDSQMTITGNSKHEDVLRLLTISNSDLKTIATFLDPYLSGFMPERAAETEQDSAGSEPVNFDFKDWVYEGNGNILKVRGQFWYVTGSDGSEFSSGTVVKHSGNQYTINWTLGADMKMLENLPGIRNGKIEKTEIVKVEVESSGTRMKLTVIKGESAGTSVNLSAR